ncbi:MAG: hypothetical protein HKP10_04715 [Kiritimatiellales bacterium]|nr:hypothetical protein [Kiritimatiellales bacterium]
MKQKQLFAGTRSIPSLRIVSLLTVFLLGGTTNLFAQNRDAYGVWARGGDVDFKDYPYKGVEHQHRWSDIEKKDGVFDWKSVDSVLKDAAANDSYVFLSINVAQDAPHWIYKKGVEKYTTKGHRHTGPYPDHLDPKHIAYYHRMIDAFGKHVRSLPERLLKRVVFIQVKTGSTGDEAPHKGVPTDKNFEMSDKDWEAYRLAAFKQFHTAFQQGSGPVIPLMYTSVVYDKGERKLLQWISENVKGGWGTKMGGTGQGYQINSEVPRTEEILQHTIDAAENDTYELFTRCEMDQGWKEGIFEKNIKQAFYWTSLSAVHSGLSMWNITTSARNWHHKNDYWEDFNFFNKYAGQTHSVDATAAFCALREGLDSSDTVKFPESEFGEASIKNEERYLAICASRSAYGAKMDDVNGVLAGMMKQRRGQQGLNDSGWEIFRGNYERFLHQIDPDQTSVGWWRVGGKITSSSPVYGRFARGFEHKSGKDAMAFDIKDSFFAGKPLSGAYPITVRVVYYDKGKGQWALEYDAVRKPNKRAVVVKKTDSGKWKEKIVTLKDAHFGNRGRNGSDLSLINTDDEDDIFHIIEVERVKSAR